jgi:hypothetical protein
MYYEPCCARRLDDSSPAPAAAEPEASAAQADRRSQSKSEAKLGTGHGHREASPAQYVNFQRASSTPDETIVIYYDSRRNLVAQGVLPDRERPWFADRRPEPFPNGFVPDP